MRYFGLPEEDFPSQRVGNTVAIFSDNLEAFLDLEWPEWIASCTAVEAAAGISLRKNQLAYRTATAEADGTVPEMLTQILKKIEEL